MSNDNSSQNMAIFCDFENIALGVRDFSDEIGIVSSYHVSEQQAATQPQLAHVQDPPSSLAWPIGTAVQKD